MRHMWLQEHISPIQKVLEDAPCVLQEQVSISEKVQKTLEFPQDRFDREVQKTGEVPKTQFVDGAGDR